MQYAFCELIRYELVYDWGMSADSDHSFTDDPPDDPPGGRDRSPEEFVDAWAAHEREGARLALDAVRIAAGGLGMGMCRWGRGCVTGAGCVPVTPHSC